MNSKLIFLAKHLEQEIIWIEEINALLAEEKNVLDTRQYNLLESIANKKQELSGKMEESAQQRTDFINDLNANAEKKLSLKEFLKNCSAEEANKINTLNNKLFERLTTCRELNSVNGQVISGSLHTRQQVVNILSGKSTDGIGVYTATGNIKSSTDNNHHQEA